MNPMGDNEMEASTAPAARVVDDLPIGALHPSIPKAVREATYLSTRNAERYRVITHFFYERYKLQQHRLKPRQVWQYVREMYDAQYSLEQCISDLGSLFEFRTLAREQDRDSVSSIEEWHNRDHVYDITPITIRLEEALEKQRLDGGRRASLDPTLIESIRSGLDGLHRAILHTDDRLERDRDYVAKNIRRPWLNLYGQFTELTTSTNAFHHALRDAHPQDLNEIEAFRIYKDILLDNLSGFINELVDAGEHLRGLMQTWTLDRLDVRLINILTEHEQYYFDASNPDEEPLDARSRYAVQVTSLVSWFEHDGGIDALRRTTRNAIETVVRVTARITDRMRAGSSRRTDLIRLARAFAACRTLEDAHLLGATTLGSPTSRHIHGAEDWGLMTDSRSVWDQATHEVPLRRIVRGAKPKPKPQPVIDLSVQQAALLKLEAEKKRQEQEAWNALFAGGEIDIGDLTVDNPELRDRILEALDSCLLSEGLVGNVSDGSAVRLIPPEPGTPPGRLRAPDGDLLTPRYRIVRDLDVLEEAS